MANLLPKIRGRAIFFAVVVLALAARLPRLADRPMHTDEAVNARILGQILEGKPYQYDPVDRHGPALYALAWPVARLSGASTFANLTEQAVRMGPVFAGVGLVALLGVLASQVGTAPAVSAAMLFAIAPLPVYYSRYFIHETLFVLATLGFLIFGLRALVNKSCAHGLVAGLCAGLMLACKETAVLHFIAFGIAGWIQRLSSPGPNNKPYAKTALVMAGGFLCVTGLLYTWGGTHLAGLRDLACSMPHWISRAGGQGHEKSWWYYLKLLSAGWSGPLFVALVIFGCVRIVQNRDPSRPLRPILAYAVSILIFYSVIPYKTPWLALNIFLPLALLAGSGMGVVWEMNPGFAKRGIVIVGISVLFVVLCRDTRRYVYILPADEKNPYAYAHTSEDLLRLPLRVDAIANQLHSGNTLRISVVAKDPWPLPWYLRKFPNCGFWQPGQSANEADIYITSSEAAAIFKEHSAQYRPEFFGVRPETLLILWSRPDAIPGHE